jgi:hypothetical protein
LLDPNFDPLATLDAVIESVNSQAALLDQLVQAHNRQEKMLHHLSMQCEILNQQIEKERNHMVGISKLILKHANDSK